MLPQHINNLKSQGVFIRTLNCQEIHITCKKIGQKKSQELLLFKFYDKSVKLKIGWHLKIIKFQVGSQCCDYTITPTI